MPFSFTCPYCHLKTYVDDAYLGSSGPCAGCGKTVTIPGGRRSSKGNKLPGLDPENDPHPDHDTLESVAIPKKPAKPPFGIYLIRWIAALSIMAAMLVIVLFTMLPAIQRAMDARKGMLCRANLQQIANALNEYADRHGTYPPPVVFDAAGKPLYSWRVLILPQLGYQDLYDGFFKDQVWDSPSNLNLVRSMPRVFASPGSPDAASLGETTYVLLTGKGTLFPTTGPMTRSAIKDNPNQTVLVVETVNNGTSWTAPGDIDVSRGVTMGNRPFRDIGGNHRNGANVVTVDATPLFLPPDISPAMLDALVTPSGGERLDTSNLTP